MLKFCWLLAFTMSCQSQQPAASEDTPASLPDPCLALPFPIWQRIKTYAIDCWNLPPLQSTTADWRFTSTDEVRWPVYFNADGLFNESVDTIAAVKRNPSFGSRPMKASTFLPLIWSKGFSILLFVTLIGEMIIEKDQWSTSATRYRIPCNIGKLLIVVAIN